MNVWTRIIYCVAVSLLSQAFCSQQAWAEEDDATALVAIIQAVEKGWEEADGTPFRDYFLDFEGARYIESGGQNNGLSDLIEHHVEPEGDALDSLELVFSDIETHIEGDFACSHTLFYRQHSVHNSRISFVSSSILSSDIVSIVIVATLSLSSSVFI